MVLAEEDQIKTRLSYQNKSERRRSRKHNVALNPCLGVGVMLVTVILAVLPACRHEKKIDVAASINPDKMPTMVTKDVSTLISDSGITQYKIVTPIWYVYDNVDTPYWNFPKGIYLRKYDRNFKVIATIAADSARYFSAERLWRLEGNVEMTKSPRDIFLSERLFWDQGRRKIYSDTFIHIENATHTLEGTGFVSNDRLTVYRVLKPTGIFPVNSADLRPAGGNEEHPVEQGPAKLSGHPSTTLTPSIDAQPRISR